MKLFFNLLHKIADISGYAAGWLVPLMVVLVAVEVFMRYVLSNPPMVADEFSAYMLVALSYMGMSFTWRKGGHVRVDILVSRLPARLANWIRLTGLIFIFIFMIGMTHSAYHMITYALKINLRSDTWLTVPLFWPQLTIFIGFTMLLLTIFSDIVKTIGTIRAGHNIEEHTK